MKRKNALRWGLSAYTAILLGLGGYTLLDALVIPHELEAVGLTAADLGASTSESSTSTTSANSTTLDGATHGHLSGKRHAGRNSTEVKEVSDTNSTSSSGSASSDTTNSGTSANTTTTNLADQLGGATVIGSYEQDGVSIELVSTRVNNTTVYLADVQLSSADQLKTAFAQDSYARNVKDETSEIAEAHNAILAINGDYYGWHDSGFVLRNGTLYRETSAGNEALVIDATGTLSSVDEDSTSARDLLASGATQVLSFGPTLVEDGQIAVDENEEVGQAKSSNPRTAIGQVGPLHYLFVVSDGRTDESEGLSLYELAQVMREAGCTFAYNLDGGGSSTLWFDGQVINTPTSGRSSGERAVSDIVYIGRS